MTLGITGVFWLPRMAELNSLSLNAGAHAVPIVAAGTAWGALAAGWADATATVARVMAEVGVGLQGLNGINVLGRLTGFTVWSEQQTVMAGVMAAKTAANATAYTVASLVMPSLPEIALVEAARVAAHSTGGALNGTAEAAEAAKLALDIRAALVMETYEFATTTLVTTPGEFFMPPPIAMGAGSAEAGAAANAFGDGTSPVQAALGAAAAFANNPGVLSAVSQAAGTVVTGVATTAGTVAETAITAVGNGLTQAVPGANPGIAAGLGAAAVAAGGAASIRAAGFGGGGGVSIGNGGGTLRLPEGWGAGSGIGGGAAPLAEPMPGAGAGNAAAAPVRQGPGAHPLLGNQAARDEEEAHGGKGFGRSERPFSDGDALAPAVIGGEPGDAR
ncbi:PPE domain-containing protein [Nocardia sp. NPDC057668]|uniref:PPE domain-containing protein n=1 Tax=Nocardia sp. NPDC057668 TaxID=3346202 RepID=UPI00366FF4B0